MARAGISDRRRPVPMASSTISPQAAARSTLGSGLQTMTKPRVSAPPSRAVALSEMPSRGARPRRSARIAVPGGPISSARTMVRLLPETARRWVRSVARNASCSSIGTREVSPTTSPGNSARASGASPSVASRSPARSLPAVRWRAVGCPMMCGGSPSGTRRTAAIRSLPGNGGASRTLSRSRVEGSRPSQEVGPVLLSRAAGAWLPAGSAAPAPLGLPRVSASRSPGSPGVGSRARSRTGVRAVVAAPSRVTTRVTSALSTTPGRGKRSPCTRGRDSRGSSVTSNSTVAYAY